MEIIHIESKMTVEMTVARREFNLALQTLYSIGVVMAKNLSKLIAAKLKRDAVHEMKLPTRLASSRGRSVSCFVEASRMQNSTDIGNAKQPTIKSAVARLATSKLKGDRRLRFGSIITARKTRIFPTTATTERTEQNVAEVMLKLVGAETFEQGYDPSSDMSECEDLSSVTS